MSRSGPDPSIYRYRATFTDCAGRTVVAQWTDPAEADAYPLVCLGTLADDFTCPVHGTKGVDLGTSR